MEEQQDLGENRTEWSVSNEEIRKTATTQCKVHSWKKLSECEVYCANCPTAIIVSADYLKELVG